MSKSHDIPDLVEELGFGIEHHAFRGPLRNREIMLVTPLTPKFLSHNVPFMITIALGINS
jgi:hypothetical protein